MCEATCCSGARSSHIVIPHNVSHVYQFSPICPSTCIIIIRTRSQQLSFVSLLCLPSLPCLPAFQPCSPPPSACMPSHSPLPLCCESTPSWALRSPLLAACWAGPSLPWPPSPWCSTPCASRASGRSWLRAQPPQQQSR